jgi:hypothetical protein
VIILNEHDAAVIRWWIEKAGFRTDTARFPVIDVLESIRRPARRVAR